MKSIFRSKTVGIIALIATITSTSLPKPALAQAQNACTIASTQVPSSTFDGLDLSTTQMSVYDGIIKNYNDQIVPGQFAKAKRVVKPNAVVLFFPKQGEQIPSKLQEALSVEAGNAKPAQIAALNAKYSQYGRFVPETTLVYDQALFEEHQKEVRLLQNRILSVMNPVQQQRYKQNQAAFETADKACGIQNGPFVKVGDSYEMGGSYL
jgi:hypothetical protein